MTRYYIISTLLLLSYVTLSLQSGCSETTVPNSEILFQIETFIYATEFDPGNDLYLLNSFTNCIAHGVDPDNIAYVGISFKYIYSPNNNTFFSGRLVYSCVGGSLELEISLSDNSDTKIEAADPIFLDSNYVREDCHSCNADMPSNNYTCEECNVSCQIPNNTLGFCFGPSPSECCRYLHNNSCVAECPGGFTPDTNNTCICTTTCLNGTLNSTCECECTADYFGTRCENQFLPCDTFPCINGTCSDGIGDMVFTCDCQSGFNGTLCDNNIEDCVTNPCGPGTCTDGVSSYSCMCPTGYIVLGNVSHPNCTYFNECDLSPCQNGGNCSDFIGGYNCSCPMPYTGTNCSECSINSCGNGTNVNCSCVCYSGHLGEFCESDTNECDSMPCQNSGLCIDGNGTYTCDCSGTSHEGVNCENITDNCVPDPCVHGQCNNSIGNYTCMCDGNYSGKNCSDCEITCNNGGSVSTDCSCECANTGYEGERCENDVNECLANPCMNNGSCQNSNGNYSCICDGNYTGRNCTNCDITCGNGGNITSDCSCECANTGFEGGRCENDVNECIANPCMNNGNCQNYAGNYSCSCLTGFEGVNCQTDINECHTSPCQNGGACQNTLGSFNCSCLFGYNGSLCENVVTNCSYIHCLNEGECVQTNLSIYCDCPALFTGVACEIELCANGFEFREDMCVNINECQRHINVCGELPANCNDDIPLYSCGCPDGYTTNETNNSSQISYCNSTLCSPKLCIDRDECSLGTHNCHLSQECVNTNGSFICICPAGLQQKGDICVLSVVNPDCPMGQDSSGHLWPGVGRGSVVRLQCVNSYFGVAERTCYAPCECSNGSAYWGIPQVHSCSSVGLQTLAAELESLGTFQELNGVTFNQTVNNIQTFVTTNSILAEDIRNVFFILHTIMENIGRINSTLLEKSIFVDVLKIADVALATTPSAWNEIGNTRDDVLFVYDVILETAVHIAKYLYASNSEFEFNFNSDNIQLHLITFHAYTNNIADYSNYKPTTDYMLELPHVNTNMLNLPSSETADSCQIYIQTLYLPTFHLLLNSYQQTACGDTETRSLIFPTPLFTFGVYSVLCGFEISNLSSPFFYRVNASGRVADASYSLQAVTQPNSFAPTSCQGPTEELGYLLFTCHSIQNYFLTLTIPTAIHFQATILGILLRVLFPLSAVLCLVSLALLLTKYVVLVDGMTYVRVNIILTLLFSQILFTIGIDRNESHIVCVVLRFLLYYMSITTIIWSLIDIVNVCLITVFDWYRGVINLTYLIVGYLIPIGPIIVTMSLSFCSYTRNAIFCMPSTFANEYAIWYIEGPLLLLLFVFVCLAVLVAITIGYRRRNIRVELASDYKLFARIIFSSLLLPLLLFIFWISTILAFATDEPYFISQVVSLVTGALIGMFILFIYVIASAEQFKPTKSGRKEEEMIAFTHIATERITFNPLFKDSQSDVHSVVYTRDTTLSNYSSL